MRSILRIGRPAGGTAFALALALAACSDNASNTSPGALSGSGGSSGGGGTEGTSGDGTASGGSAKGGSASGAGGTGSINGAAAGGGSASSQGGSDAGAGGTGNIAEGGTSDGNATDDGGEASSTHPRPECVSKPSQVILVGDSYINWITHTFPADLNAAAGLPMGEAFRDYAVGGYSMATGGIGLIPPEFDKAVGEDPDIVTIVMDGGGNDVLIPDAMYAQGADCKQDANSPTIADCQDIVAKAIDAATTLMNKVADHGIRDVTYFFYPHVPEGTVIGGAHPNAILDYALPKVKAVCDGAYAASQGKLTCHFVDTIPVMDGHPDWFAAMDIHPNSMGSAAIAKAVWKRMQDDCVGQPESSGCCDPK